jgi:hypothetical protein
MSIVTYTVSNQNIVYYDFAGKSMEETTLDLESDSDSVENSSDGE